jgi:hypothetical protein
MPASNLHFSGSCPPALLDARLATAQGNLRLVKPRKLHGMDIMRPGGISLIREQTLTPRSSSISICGLKTSSISISVKLSDKAESEISTKLSEDREFVRVDAFFPLCGITLGVSDSLGESRISA